LLLKYQGFNVEAMDSGCAIDVWVVSGLFYLWSLFFPIQTTRQLRNDGRDITRLQLPLMIALWTGLHQRDILKARLERI